MSMSSLMKPHPCQSGGLYAVGFHRTPGTTCFRQVGFLQLAGVVLDFPMIVRDWSHYGFPTSSLKVACKALCFIALYLVSYSLDGD